MITSEVWMVWNMSRFSYFVQKKEKKRKEKKSVVVETWSLWGILTQTHKRTPEPDGGGLLAYGVADKNRP